MSLDFIIIIIAAEMVAHRLVGLKHNYKLYDDGGNAMV